MTPLFRHHDTVPAHVPSDLYRRLLQEWVSLNALPSSAATLHKWSRTEHVLAAHSRPGDVVDAIDAATHEAKDETLLALIRLFQAGHQLAGRVVLQALLPKLTRLTSSTGITSSDNAWTEDRRHIVVAEFWDVLGTYPVDRRPSHIASNLALDTLNRVTRTRAQPTETPVDPTDTTVWDERADDDDANASHGLNATANLAQVTFWAQTHGVLTAAEADLITTVYTDQSGACGAYGFDAIATDLGISPAAVRQRCSRAVRRLTTAVRAELLEHASTNVHAA